MILKDSILGLLELQVASFKRTLDNRNGPQIANNVETHVFLVFVDVATSVSIRWRAAKTKGPEQIEH